MALAYYVMSSIERSVVQTNAPGADKITEALQSAATNTLLRQALNLLRGGPDWVGPMPRITRRYSLGALRGNLTTVAWVFSFDSDQMSPQQFDAAAQAAKAYFDQALATTGNWDPVAITRWSEPANGPLSWWRSGQASVTMTRDAFPELGGRLAANENPIGPDTPESTLPTVGQGVGQQTGAAGAQGAADLLKTLGVLAVGGVALYLALPYLNRARGGSERRRNRRRSYGY